MLCDQAIKKEQIPTTEASSGKFAHAACNRTEGGYSNPDSSQMSANSFWRKAEAYHFWMLAQRQLYEGQFEYASRTSLILEEYEDVIGPTQTQSLIAMASYCCRNFSRCSRSLMRLGRLDACMRPKIQHFPNTTTSIFSQHLPAHHSTNKDPGTIESFVYISSRARIMMMNNVCFASGRQEIFSKRLKFCSM